MNPKRNNYLKNSLRSIQEYVNRKNKIRLVYLAALLLSTAVFDVFGLAFILPVISVATNPELIQEDKILSYLYNTLGFTDNNEFIIFLIVSLFIIFIAKSTWGIMVAYLQTRLVTDMALSISRDQFYKYFSIPYPEFQNLKSSVITKDIVANAVSYIQWIVLSMITVFTEGFIILLIVAGIALFNIQLFVFISLIVIPAAALTSRIIRNKSKSIGTGIDTYFPLSLASAGQAIQGYTDIKLTGKEDYYINRFSDYQKNYLWFSLKQSFVNQIPFRTNEIIALLGMIIIFVYALFVSDNQTDLITLISLFAAASYRMMPSLNRIVNALNFMSTNQVSINNLDKYMHYFYKQNSLRIEQQPLNFEQDIEFRDVTYKFNEGDTPVLKGVNLIVRKGEKIGFVGKSGSGKTTLMNILLQFYVQQEGQLLVDGVPVTLTNTVAWRNKIGYVKQDIFLLDASIKENIALGEDQVDEEKLSRAIQQASLADFINSLPDGTNTLIGERGSRLSGGQKQRIGIARSLYRNAEVLIFDEATSALDTITETEVTQAIDNLGKSNKTIFIIAHRITTLKNCNRIYELENGSVAGAHSYKELIEKVI
ncbi:MAG: ABC transporter ATP-binding protein/permease [Bacteroidia bacterium]|nr:ABC transporter ATP-binding protein [Bacteroidia bacterium]MCZ2278087.1 ABC transporter ATP-binding protein/permease [Bacteroidia bacterium]